MLSTEIEKKEEQEQKRIEVNLSSSHKSRIDVNYGVDLDANLESMSDSGEYVSLFDSFTPEEIADLQETAHEFFDDYIAEYAIEMSDPDFKHNMCSQLTADLYYDMSWLELCDADHIEEIREWVEEQCDLFYDFLDIPHYSFENPHKDTILNDEEEQIIEKIKYYISTGDRKKLIEHKNTIDRIKKKYDQPRANHSKLNRDEIANENLGTIEFYLCGDEIYDKDVQSVAKEIKDAFTPYLSMVGRLSNIQTLDYVKSIPQVAQRTQEWYDERDNMITASSVWKIFASEAQRNSLIYDKCVGSNGQRKSSAFGGPSTLQWGTKYEPVSRELYMLRHPTYGKVEEYGCIPHRQYPFLGASPDGIAENGRMLEIKNIVNREITGEPLEAYWIQMQIQMEVCDLEVCDFVETRFKEFDSERAFYESEHETKGVILQFMPRTNVMTGEITGSPEYVYFPLLFNSDKQTIDEWIQEKQAEREDSVLYYTYYWWLDEYSECVVQRNRLWFEAAIPEIEDCWNTVVKERAEGYGHRAPQSRKSMASILAHTVLDSNCKIEDVHQINCVIPNNYLNIVKLE